MGWNAARETHICNRFKLKTVKGEKGKPNPSGFSRGVRIYVCLRAFDAECGVCLSCSRQPFCELREVTCRKRKCTFSISRGERRGGGCRAEWEDSWREPRVMQVGLQNVLVSRKPDVSNLVLSGPATISWLFEPSGPCSSDLRRRIFIKASQSYVG